MPKKPDRKYLLVEQIVNDLLRRIRIGEFEDGRLPSERKLASE